MKLELLLPTKWSNKNLTNSFSKTHTHNLKNKWENYVKLQFLDIRHQAAEDNDF